MSKLSQQFRDNSSQVRDAEKRLAIQHTFIEQLRASGKETKTAEETLEVMRDILRDLYNSQASCDVGSRRSTEPLSHRRQPKGAGQTQVELPDW